MASKTAIKMKALTRQEGPDSRRLDKDAEFEVFSEQDALVLVEKRLAERISPAAPTEEEAATAQAEEDEANGEWKLQLTPEEYIAKYPDGPNTKLAKAVLAKRKADGKDVTP